MSGKNRKLKTVFIVIAVAVAALFVAEAVLISHYLDLIYYKPADSGTYTYIPEETVPEEDAEKPEEIIEFEQYLDENAIEEPEPEYEFDDDVFNILLIGLDNRTVGDVDRGRTDTMLIVSVNRKTERIVVTSLMRDSYVKIPGVGSNRLNTAYANGGAQLLFDTIEANYKIHLTNYALVDFYSFIDVIDAIGGVDIVLSAEEIFYINDFVNTARYELEAGLDVDVAGNTLDYSTAGSLTHLNGLQALSYARNRSIGADYGRTERQRKVMLAAMEQMKHLSLAQINTVAEAVLPGITTNMSKTDILALAAHAYKYLDYQKVSLRLPADGTMWETMMWDMSVICADYKENFRIWYREVYGDDPGQD